MASDFIKDGRPDPDSKNDILDALIADAKTKLGNDLNDTEESIIRQFYEPVAERLAEAQEDLAAVLDSVQIDHAEEKALDLLTDLIGATREEAKKATGTVTFSRSTTAGVDYSIPKGTEVQTDSNDPIKFKTTEEKTLASGTTSVDAPIEAIEGGTDGNVGANTITVISDPPAGIEEVTNANATTGGTDREEDDDLRERAKEELSEGSRASVPALISALEKVSGVTSVKVIENDSNSTDVDGRPSHSVEPVVGGNYQNNDVAQAIYDTKAGGMPIVGGYAGTSQNGTATLPNGDTKTVTFSSPTQVQIYVDATIEKTDEYEGDNAVKDAVVTYIGGTLSDSETEIGLGAGDDVLIGEVEYAIRSVKGVYDVTDLKIGESASPTGTSNIAIAEGETAIADATDGSITLTVTAV